MEILAPILLIVFAAVVITLVSRDGESEHMEVDDFYNTVDKLSDSAFDCSKTSSVKEKLSEMEELYERIDNAKNSTRYKQYLQTQIQDVREEYEDRIRCEWQEKADEILDEFWDLYSYVVNTTADMYNFSDLNKAKAKALALYEKLMWLRDPDAFVNIRPHEYIKSYLGNNYDPCMNSRWELGQKLDSIIESAKPEKKRGEKLNREIIGFVKSKGSVKRAELKKHTFQGYTDDEVSAAYKLLIKKYKIVEYKIGNLYFVSLPEKLQSTDSNSKNISVNNTDTETG